MTDSVADPGAGSGRAATVVGGGPAIVLVEPQLGENIGMVARAMANCGLDDLRLVRPRDGWPSATARAAAAGAEWMVDAVRVFDSTAEAIADRQRIYATTARRRDLAKPTMSPRAAAAEMRSLDERTGVLFGREAAGLANDDVAVADAILQVPLSPVFRSLNLAQAVLLIGYEWFQAGGPTVEARARRRWNGQPATKQEMIGLFEHLERELDGCGFLRVAAKRPTMVRNLRSLFGRAGLSKQEVRTLRGVIDCLVTRRQRDRDRDGCP